jgi:hypothetical protein
MFTVLLDEMLGAMQERLTNTAAAARSFQYAQRFYGEAIEAFLALQSPPASASAPPALSGCAGFSTARPPGRRKRASFSTRSAGASSGP